MHEKLISEQLVSKDGLASELMKAVWEVTQQYRVKKQIELNQPEHVISILIGRILLDCALLHLGPTTGLTFEQSKQVVSNACLEIIKLAERNRNEEETSR